MPEEHSEIINGQEFKVTVLPSDKRLQPSQVKRRTLWQSLSAQEKQRYFADAEAKAQKKRKRRRRK